MTPNAPLPEPTFAKVFSPTALLKAFEQCRKHKSNKPDVIRFELELGQNIAKLAHELGYGAYRFGKYKTFNVFEPKKREIQCLPFRDRVVLMALCKNVIEPTLETRLLPCNTACRKGKGVHYAIRYLDGILKRHFAHHGTDGYILKCDISKFFASINHDVLWGLVNRFDIDPQIMRLIRSTIYENGMVGAGLPIGNQTSQWWALLALHPVDVLARDMGIPYVRYMDDFVLVHPCKATLLTALDQIKELLAKLGLKLNDKTQIMPIRQGVDFLGFRHRVDAHGLVDRPLRAQSQTRLRQNIRELAHLFKTQKVGAPFVETRMCCYLAHMLHSRPATMYFKRTISKSPNRDILRKIIANTKIKLLRETLGQNI